MKFYKVVAERHDYFTGYTTVVGELVTQRERDSRFRFYEDITRKDIDMTGVC